MHELINPNAFCRRVTRVFPLIPRRRLPYTPQLVLPPAIELERIRSLYFHDERPTTDTSFWKHLTLDCYLDRYRLTVTAELLPCAPYQRNTPRNRWSTQDPDEFTAYRESTLRSEVPRRLAEISDVVDAALLGRVRTHQPPGPVHATYADTGFHFVLPEQLTETSLTAYREFPTNFGVRDPVALLNDIARHALRLGRITVTVTLREE